MTRITSPGRLSTSLIALAETCLVVTRYFDGT